MLSRNALACHTHVGVWRITLVGRLGGKERWWGVPKSGWGLIGGVVRRVLLATITNIRVRSTASQIVISQMVIAPKLAVKLPVFPLECPAPLHTSTVTAVMLMMTQRLFLVKRVWC